MPLKFAPTTKVRNQYEMVNPETGNVEVELNEYNANASGNVNMPGYSMHNPGFRPHSKSSIQRAETVMRELRHEQQMALGTNGVEFNTGLRPALSANGYPGYVHYTVNRDQKVRNMQLMQSYYGDAWVDALAELETIEEEEEIAMKQLYQELEQNKRVLEEEFTRRTGLKSPTELTKLYQKSLRDLENAGLFSAEYRAARSSAKDRYTEEYNKIPVEEAEAYKAQYNELRSEIESRIVAYDAIKVARVAQIRVGRPIGAVNRRTFKNRLNAAQNRARASAVATPTSCVGCLPK